MEARGRVTAILCAIANAAPNRYLPNVFFSASVVPAQHHPVVALHLPLATVRSPFGTTFHQIALVLGDGINDGVQVFGGSISDGFGDAG